MDVPGERTEKARPRKRSFNRRQSLAEQLVSKEDLGVDIFDASLFKERSIEFFEAKYELGMMIGEGATGRVFLGVCKDNSMDVAVKIIHEKVLLKNSEIIREILILHQLSHPNIIRLIDVILTEDRLHIVMELARGAELFDSIVEKKNYGEQDAAKVVRQVCSALHYLHSNSVSHRDLKPENLLYFSDSEDATIKLVDFGLSTTSDDLKCNMTGTLGYKAPELFKAAEGVTEQNQLLNVQGAPCDMWALGIISYILLCGFPPFFSEEHFNSPDFQMNAPFWVFFNEETPMLIEQICHKDITFPDQFWEAVSDPAKDFITRLLKKDPGQRMKAKEALCHPWLSTPTATPTPLPKAAQTLSFFLRKKQKLSKKFEMILEDTTPPPSPRRISPASSPNFSAYSAPSPSSSSRIASSPNFVAYSSRRSLTLPGTPITGRTPPPSPTPTDSPAVPLKSPRNVKGRRKSLVVGRVPVGNEHLVSPRIHQNLISLDRAMVKNTLKDKLKHRPERNEEKVERIVKCKSQEAEPDRKRVGRVLDFEKETEEKNKESEEEEKVAEDKEEKQGEKEEEKEEKEEEQEEKQEEEEEQHQDQEQEEKIEEEEKKEGEQERE
uniref:non-specific serine/threonine protein kinase n=1 Tax=Paramoeba aestuarina TaxID=180227 RepID=A0A7S4U6A9_9EUKA|mmetsp:Transcript_35909/g.56146  ORF Transcript_35909/g.56146 Transcript_35909/m.56146 type:complete len:608 (+) Transcript_35909:173-1996(+)|eukprot:CAMPEP_0201510102 /NCGR_PEP_ID=MMETSP0161_2-20130828/2936_1 /ASSEMBLY_ACC=CAM_ASM_000251 /TAXON_ID=180227 /ORGANISM="Neoparamoeba aestuarina, Strain SoJaBio B1-5/56/2" /LENGTH=607 /DNA_ID=CAMNT_0047905231 /DNA_START=171 /DNA_END=1994 /DNA_ORIENTATION=-